jgi:RNA polymerase sigma-70 factor
MSLPFRSSSPSQSSAEPLDQEPSPAAGLPGPELFEILVREHETRLRAFVGSLVRDPGSAEDIAQEAFVVAWRNLHRYDRSQPFGPWLRGIARRLVMAHHRKLGRSKLEFVEEEVVDHLGRLHELLEQNSGDTLDEQLSSLRACFEHLPEHQQRVLEMHYADDLACGDISTAVGRSREAVKKILQRSRAWLGRCIEERLRALGSDAVPDAGPARSES